MKMAPDKLAVVGTAVTLWATACTPMNAARSPVLAGVGTFTHIDVDVTHVYLASRQASGTTITRVDKERSESQAVAKVVAPIEQLALANDSVYWLIQHKVGEKPVVAIQKAEKKANAKVENLVSTTETITSFALDATHLYWAKAGDPDHKDEMRSQGIVRTMDPASTPTNVVTRLKGEPHRITLGGSHVYWVTKESDGGSAVMAWPKFGGDPIKLTVFHRSDVQLELPALAASDDGVYVLTPKELVHLAIDGKSTRRVKNGFTATVPDLLFDFKHLYFRTHGGLMRVQPNGEEFLPMAPFGQGHFAVDDTDVFWFDGDKVFKDQK